MNINIISLPDKYSSVIVKMVVIMSLIQCLSIGISFSQNTKLTVIDIAQTEVKILNQCKKMDSISRSKLLLDSLYLPYKTFWNGYVGQQDSFLDWMANTAIPALDIINKKNDKIDGKKLFAAFNKIAAEMKKLTGFEPVGTWYIVYGPAWTDLGGLGSLGMLIDLSHQSNSSAEKIIKMLPHELTHQILARINKTKDSSALSSIIGEGFAVYMNEIYWKTKYSPPENLGYSESEYFQCIKQNRLITSFFKQNYKSTTDSIIQKFRNRSIQINAGLPGAIGYYIGYEIIRLYVIKHGKNSWKHVFTKSPEEIYNQSGY